MSRAHSRPNPPVAIEVFAGVGGLSLGIERAGFDVASAVEIDANHTAVHKFNFPRTEVLKLDANHVSSRTIRDSVRAGLTSHGRRDTWNGSVDLLAGGPPCQGFSVGGIHDPQDRRNELILAFSRLVRDVKPRYFVMENVPGLLRSKHKKAWERVCNTLIDAGYELSAPSILNAADFGVPQTRKRLFLYGWRRGEAAVKPPTGRAYPVVSVEEALRGLPNASAYPAYSSSDLWDTRDPKQRALMGLESSPLTYAASMWHEAASRGFPRHWNESVLSGMALTEHSKCVIGRFEKTKPGEREAISRYPRLDPAGLSPTLRSGTGADHGSHTPPRPIHPSGKRVITVREAARLHSFPDWFTFHATKWHAWRGIGNAVPPLMAKAVTRRVADAIGAIDFLNESLEAGDYCSIGYSKC